MIDWKAKLIDALHRCMKLDVFYTQKFSLICREGTYEFADPRMPFCNALESVLLGEFAVVMDPVDQVALILGKDRCWVNGFVAKLAGNVEEVEEHFRQGFQDGSDGEIGKFLRVY